MRLGNLVFPSVNLEYVTRQSDGRTSGKCILRPTATVAAGTSLNVALALQRAGDTVKLLASIAKDSQGRELEQQITDLGVDAHFFFIRSSTPWTLSNTRDGEDEPHLLCIKDAYLDFAETDDLRRKVREQVSLTEPERLIATSVREDDLPFVRLVFEEARNLLGRRCSIIMTPHRELAESGKWREVIGEIDLLVLNDVEAAALVAPDGDGFEPEHLARLLELVGEVVVTCNRHGAYFAETGSKPHYQALVSTPENESQVVDRVGAGDCFLGYFCALRPRYGVEKALRYASAAASLKVQQPGGSSSPTLEEVEDFLQIAKEVSG